jgi:hypothetical protein
MVLLSPVREENFRIVPQLGHDCIFQILSDSLLMNNPTIRLYTVWILTASLNEPQKYFYFSQSVIGTSKPRRMGYPCDTHGKKESITQDL